MTIQHTPRLQLPYPKETAPRTDSADVPRDVAALAVALDSAALDDQGILADRPVSTVSTPGIAGRYYFVTGDADPAQNGRLYRDNGTGWNEIASVGSTSGTLAQRPAANSVRAGSFYYATDQVALYRSDGTAAWTRVTEAAGKCSLIFTDTADPGHILVTGQAWPGTTGIYADLYAKWSGKYPTALPDPLGRSLVVKGTHPDVDQIGDNDGLAAAARRVRHKHTVNDPGHRHTMHGQNEGTLDGNNGVGGVATTADGIDSAAMDLATTGITVGPQTGSEPVDGPAWITLNMQVKL